MASPTSPHPDANGDQLTGRRLVGRYRLNRPIASGGMAEVWDATDETLTRRVAVKLLHPHLARDDSFVQRFRAEAVAAARLTHPSIVSVYDTFSSEGFEAIVMELVTGTTMRADLDAHGPMRLTSALAIGTQVADALGAAHASGLVHRDVKPANILLSADGRVLVADFGIAKAAEGTDLTGAGAMIGTAKYLAPEQVEGGPIDGRADLYSLGVVLYEALTGQAPFVADTDAGTALARLHRDPVPARHLRPDLPVAVDAVITSALARNRDHRFPSAAAMRAALLDASTSSPPGPPATTPPVPPPASVAARPQPQPQPQLPAPPGPPPVEAFRPPPQPAPTQAPVPTRPSRAWLVVVAVFALATVAGLFVVRSASDRPPPGAVLPIEAATSFDPQGDNLTEREDLVGGAIDGDPDTAWKTERYGDPDAMFGKDGVGLIVTLSAPAEVTAVELTTTEAGWAVETYLATGDAPTDLGGWGEPVASFDAADVTTPTLTVDAATADHVLVWFTRVAPSGVVELTDVTVRGR